MCGLLPRPELSKTNKAIKKRSVRRNVETNKNNNYLKYKEMMEISNDLYVLTFDNLPSGDTLDAKKAFRWRLGDPSGKLDISGSREYNWMLYPENCGIKGLGKNVKCVVVLRIRIKYPFKVVFGQLLGHVRGYKQENIHIQWI